MAGWQEFEQEQPELAASVRRRFARDKHALLATLRRGGAPRISGIETDFSDGRLVIGSMRGSAKSRDLLRDPRFALHTTSSDKTMDDGDARISGTLTLTKSTDEAEFFTADVTEVVTITVAGDQLIIESWHEGKGISRVAKS